MLRKANSFNISQSLNPLHNLRLQNCRLNKSVTDQDLKFQTIRGQISAKFEVKKL